jgi:hypothetical protein
MIQAFFQLGFWYPGVMPLWLFYKKNTPSVMFFTETNGVAEWIEARCRLPNIP